MLTWRRFPSGARGTILLMASQPDPFVTPEAYLAAERKSQHKSEYLNGVVFAMSGASRRHDRIAVNLISSLNRSLRGGPCEVNTSDLRVRAGRSEAYFYPDLTIVRGESKFEDGEFDVLLNPKVVIEILSPTTIDFDRGKKFETYRQLDSLTEYVLVAQDRVYIELYSKQENRWIFTEFSALAAKLDLPSVSVSVPLAEIYERVPLE